jgi:hypothetical protein
VKTCLTNDGSFVATVVERLKKPEMAEQSDTPSREPPRFYPVQVPASLREQRLLVSATSNQECFVAGDQALPCGASLFARIRGTPQQLAHHDYLLRAQGCAHMKLRTSLLPHMAPLFALA